MTEKFDREKYIDYVNEKLRARAKARALVNETDFLMGASCIFFYLERAGELPASWTFGQMYGESVLGKRCKECHKAPADLNDPDKELCHDCERILGMPKRRKK